MMGGGCLSVRLSVCCVPQNLTRERKRKLSLSLLRHGNSRRPAYDALSATALIGLMTLIFDLLTSK